MTEILGSERNYSSLSMRDLVQARDLFHFHLIHKANVVGTAIGLYLIRDSDPWPDDKKSDSANATQSRGPKEARTLFNSSVRDYSWPCVLVFVDTWEKDTDFVAGGKGPQPQDIVPKTIYMPDGRSVPICVVMVDQTGPDSSLLPDWHWPDTTIGGGFPIVSEGQGARRLGSVGCLVSDGHTVYALTNRHVAGSGGEPVSAILRGRDVEVGHVADAQLTRLPFSDVYPDLPMQRTWLTLDAGLIEVADVNDWTSDIYGIGSVGTLADLSDHNISLRLIGAEVSAYGAASGRLDGRIRALFYRHRSIGGYDDVSDFLIAPSGENQTRPGDSGTIWHLHMKQGPADQPADTLRPLAMQWGGQTFLSQGKPGGFAFALASSLSNILRLLDVELVSAHNRGAQPFWGKTGHYSIATFACDALPAAAGDKCGKLLRDNRDRISFEIDGLTPADIEAAVKKAKTTGSFVPLADVPDVVWKMTARQIKGGRDPRPRVGPEHPTHFADMDQPFANGQTILSKCLADPTKVTVADWQKFYTKLGNTTSGSRGLLPFRVWQFFDAMKSAAKNKNVVDFVAAAGLVAHYVGDACQPLHCSFLHDGFPDGRGKGIHSAYEDAMVNHHADELYSAIRASLGGGPLPHIATGQDAAVAIVHLMGRTNAAIPPADLVELYASTPGGKSRAVTQVLWDIFGAKTGAAMADGVHVLAAIWHGAWTAGQGDKVPPAKIAPIDPVLLKARYEDTGFVESLDLDHIGAVLS
jgi:hypothetical protein